MVLIRSIPEDSADDAEPVDSLAVAEPVEASRTDKVEGKCKGWRRKDINSYAI